MLYLSYGRNRNKGSSCLSLIETLSWQLDKQKEIRLNTAIKAAMIKIIEIIQLSTAES